MSVFENGSIETSCQEKHGWGKNMTNILERKEELNFSRQYLKYELLICEYNTKTRRKYKKTV